MLQREQLIIKSMYSIKDNSISDQYWFAFICVAIRLQKHISFQIICDGFTELLPININGRNETEREQWPCNNIYTHCNGLWNCLNDEDELDCDLSSPSSSSSNCSSDQHQCASPDINQFI
ncbi:unnamed protein product [Rotaria sordida]|uniref:Uncharacterized protein n=1 Tax=Rotaria sordida TaxID=392033 RepID=A0A819RFJ5_9BILA|nr:unnamed protein product [Rotaria sordida]